MSQPPTVLSMFWPLKHLFRDSPPNSAGRMRVLLAIWALMPAFWGIVPRVHAQDTDAKIARLANEQLQSKVARTIAQSLDSISSLNALPVEQIEMLLAGLIHARAKFRF